MNRPPSNPGFSPAHRLVRRLSPDSGANLVEFALSATILLVLTIGTMVMSIALYSYHYISEAAREGVRYASVRGSNAVTNGGLTVATSSTVQTYVRGIGFPGINASNLTVTTSWSANRTTWSTTNTANAPGDYVKVNVSYQLPVAIPFVSSRTLTMNSTALTVISD